MKKDIATRPLSLSKGRLLTIFLLTAFFALWGCGDSSSAGGDNGGGGNRGGIPDTVETFMELSDYDCGKNEKCVSTYLVEYHGEAVCDGDNGWVIGTLIEKMDCDFSNLSSDSKKGSSSSAVRGSSGNVNNPGSSSSFVLPPCRNDKIDTCIYGVLTDGRDGRSYKTVVVGEQVWMAENLNYDSGDDLSFCLHANDCEILGRHYEWSAAVDSVNSGYGSSPATCPVNVNIKGACPDGWHIPSLDEWKVLSRNAGGRAAGINLRSSKGWEKYEKEGTKGLDLYGFSIVPSPKQNIDGANAAFTQASFWTAGTEKACGINFDYQFGGDDSAATEVISSLVVNYRNAQSIRCLRDEPYSGTLASDPVSVTTHRPHPIEYYLNSDKIYGEFTDERDGHVYKTIEIDGQTWMAQNLNYKTPDGRSVCFEDDEQICEVFGRQYTWTTAIDSAGIGLAKEHPIQGDTVVQGICPSGWHVPTENEWGTLLMPASSDTLHYIREISFKESAPKLSSKKLWLYGMSHTDDYGFSLLPAFNRIRASYLTASGHLDTWGNASFNMLYLEERNSISNLSLERKMYASSLLGQLRCIKDGSAIRYPAKVRLADSCNVDGADNCDYGTLTDKRDSKVYKTIKIGEQEWMAENLRYADSAKTPSLKRRTLCRDSLDANCEKYGRLYSWLAAMDSARYYTSPKDSSCGCKYVCKLERKHQGICPDGWRLPNRIDFEILRKTTGAVFYSDGGGVPLANAGEWNDDLLRPDSLGVNVYGFGVLPTTWKESPLEAKARAEIWTSTVSYGNSSDNKPIVFADFYMRYDKGMRVQPLHWDLNDDGACSDYKAIRCIKDSE